MTNPALSPTGMNFLTRLNDAVGGDPSGQVSMYDLGSDLGLDRSAVEDALGELFAAGLAEIRSLSGQIGLTEAGQTLAAQQAPPSLSSAARSEATPDLVRELRENINRLGLNTRDAADLKADLATITAQQGSSRPKATVINACLRFIAELLAKGTDPQAKSMLERVKKALKN